MHKLLAIFGTVSAGWTLWMSSLENKPTIAPRSTYWFIYNSLNLLSWVVWAGWIIKYTIIDSNPKKTPGAKPHRLWNLLHTVPMMLLNLTINKSLSVKDKALLWFSALVVYRYYRTVVTLFFYTQYEPATNGLQDPRFGPTDCTVIVPTVGPKNNPVFEEMVAAILWNKPKRVIFSANKDEAQKDNEAEVGRIVQDFIDGRTIYQKNHELKGTWNPQDVTDIDFTHINDSNKRRQTWHAIQMVKTNIILMVDDTAIWHPKFLGATLPAFNDTSVGIVGTRKRVRYHRPTYDSEKWSRTEFLWKWIEAGFWNTVGAQYLDRHSYETRASNTADGSVFAVSARTLAILTEIVSNKDFEEAYLNEYVFGWVFEYLASFQKSWIPFSDRPLALAQKKGLSEEGIGPLLADDDNFITRWVINRGWNVKVQSSPEATITTVLGSVEIFKYLDQCDRWSRTTFRQNPIALFDDRTIWWKWPIGVWTVYFPWMYNFALWWDGWAIFTFCQSGLYRDSPNGNARLVCLILAIWATKLIKTWRWFKEHPLDFFLYFFPIPAYPAFCYYHSYIKLYTAASCWKNDWSGRNLKKAEDVAEIVAEELTGIVAGLKTD
jgi:hypothetical protein